MKETGTMAKVRVGFLGAGALANAVHHPSLAEMNDVEVVALCDLDDAKAAVTAERFCIPRRYTDLSAMLNEEDLDAVYVIVPPMDVFRPAMAVLATGKPLFLEKPPGMTRYQTEALARAAEASGSLSMVGFNRRFMPLVLDCLPRVLQHGPIEQAAVTFYKNQTEPFYGGAIDNLTSDIIHAVDLLRKLCGEPVEVQASVQTGRGFAFVSRFNALMAFDSGAVGHLLSNYGAGKRFHHAEFHAQGCSCFMELEVAARIWVDNRDEPAHAVTAEALAGSNAFHHTAGFFGENRRFIDCVKSGLQPETHLGEAVKTMALVERIHRAALS